MTEIQQKPITKGFLFFFERWTIYHWRSLLLVVLGFYLPLAIFILLATQIWQHEGGLDWDISILMAIHQTAQPTLDAIVPILTKFGTQWGVFPFSVGVALVLLYRKRWRSLTYFLIAMVGCGQINLLAKSLLHRARPSLWDYPAHANFSFPSGHAMSSMGLIAALVILTWSTRWCQPIVWLGSIFVIAIGWTRLYLGVHYPSDILAGWMMAIVWAVGVSLVVKPQPFQKSMAMVVTPKTMDCRKS